MSTRTEIPVVAASAGRIRTGEGEINTVRRGDTVYIRVGGEYPQGLAFGRQFRVSEVTVERLTPSRIRLLRVSGRGAWRKHGEIFLTRAAAAGQREPINAARLIECSCGGNFSKTSGLNPETYEPMYQCGCCGELRVKSNLPISRETIERTGRELPAERGSR